MYVDVNNARLWVEDDGDGPAILFLHGGLGDARLWAPVAERLRDAFRCIRYDVRFFGRSEGPDEEWSAVDDSIAASPRSTAPGNGSWSETRRPDAATTCAMPAPI